MPSTYSVRLGNVDSRPASSMMTDMITRILTVLLRGVRTPVPSIYSVRLGNVDFRPASSMMTSMLTLILTGLLSFAKTPSVGQVVDLSALIRRESQLYGHPSVHPLRLLPFVCGGHRQLALENLALHQQLAVYKRTATRPKLRQTDRLFWVWLARVWAGWRQPLLIVTCPSPKHEDLPPAHTLDSRPGWCRDGRWAPATSTCWRSRIR